MAPGRDEWELPVHEREAWAVMLCKLAWLRFQGDWENEPGLSTMAKEAMKEKYGISVLVRYHNPAEDANKLFKGLVCSEQDFKESNQKDAVASIVFDPTLAENRFPTQVCVWDNQSHPGTMLRSVLVPTLSEELYTDYTNILNAPVQTDSKPVAADYLRDHPPLNTFTYDPRTTYGIELFAPYEDDKIAKADSDDEEEDAKATDVGEAEVDEDEEGLHEYFNNGVDDDSGGLAMPNTGDSSGGGGTTLPPDIINVNAVALRLCVTTHKHVQDATMFLQSQCDIVKVAALGHDMLRPGINLESALSTPGERPLTDATHLFVPRYMSLVLSELGRGPDVSWLYYSVGRGFVNLGKHRLPRDWSLELLSKKNAHELVEKYSNTEVFASMVHNESLTGRMMALGAAMWNGEKGRSMIQVGALQYGQYDGAFATRRLKGATPEKSLRKVLFGLSMSSKSMTTPHHQQNSQRVFGKVRDCLAGKYKAKRMSFLTKLEKHNEDKNDQAFKDPTKRLSARPELKRYDVEGYGSDTDYSLRVGRGEQTNRNDMPECDEELPDNVLQDTAGDGDVGQGYYAIPRKWQFEEEEFQNANLQAWAKAAKKVMNREEKNLSEMGTALLARSPLFATGNYIARSRQLRKERVKAWDWKSVARKVVSAWGMASDLFDMYIKQLRKFEDRNPDLAPRVPMPVYARPDVATKSYKDKDVQAWLRLVRDAHVAYLTNEDPDTWVSAFRARARNRLLDLELGYDSATSRDWRVWRVKNLAHLGYDFDKDGPLEDAGGGGGDGGGDGGDGNDDDDDYNGGGGAGGNKKPPTLSESDALNALLSSAGVPPSEPPLPKQKKQGISKRSSTIQALKDKITESGQLLQGALNKGMDVTKEEPNGPMQLLQAAVSLALNIVRTQPSAEQEALALVKLAGAYNALDEALDIHSIKVATSRMP